MRIIYYLLVIGCIEDLHRFIAVFKPYRDLKAGDNQSLKFQSGEAGNRNQTSCSASQELNHSATATSNLLIRLLARCMMRENI